MRLPKEIVYRMSKKEVTEQSSEKPHYLKLRERGVRRRNWEAVV